MFVKLHAAVSAKTGQHGIDLVSVNCTQWTEHELQPAVWWHNSQRQFGWLTPAEIFQSSE